MLIVILLCLMIGVGFGTAFSRKSSIGLLTGVVTAVHGLFLLLIAVMKSTVIIDAVMFGYSGLFLWVFLVGVGFVLFYLNRAEEKDLGKKSAMEDK